MNRVLQWKLIAGFILVFVAGGMTGAFFGEMHARRLFFEFHHPGLMGIRMRDTLRTELNLTPEQVAKISPIIDKTAGQLKEIRLDTGQRVHEIMTEAHREIAANLTDEQQIEAEDDYRICARRGSAEEAKPKRQRRKKDENDE